MVDFAGWLLPIQYESMLAEHRHCRTAVSLFDTCHMGRFFLHGPAAAEELSLALTQNALLLPVGRGRYGFLLNENGGVLDDTILFRLAEEEFLLVVNASTAANDEAVLRSRLQRTTLTVAADWGKLDVQGPASRSVLAARMETDLSTLPYFGCCRTIFRGAPCVLARSGYTGELGYEIFLPAAELPALWDRLLASPDVRPAGLGARDSLRLEMAYPLYGHELSPEIHPIEAGLGQYVDPFRSYVGAEAIRRLSRSCPVRKLVALSSGQRRPFRAGDEIYRDGQKVGAVTSGAFSPSREEAIGLGFVAADAAAVGTDLIVRTGRADISVRVAEKPFYRNGTCRVRKEGGL